MKYKFVSLMGGNKNVVCDSFKEAFTHMYNWVMEEIKAGLSRQALETAIWIESENGVEVLYFYEARDRAINEGIMKDGGGLIE